jgi:aminopeptidase N
MESATAIFYSDISVTGERTVRWRNVIIHEVAHQWFGNCVTEYDWDDVWLSEGFATYFTLMFREYAYGREDFVEGLKQARERVFKFYEKDKNASIIHNNLTDMKKVLTYDLQYQKGAWVLHMLRNYVGDDAFRKGIRNYYSKYFNSNSTTEQFKTEMEKVSNKDLDIFFNQWLYNGGNIMLEGNWIYDKNKKEILIKLKQNQNDGYYFDMPLEVEIFYQNKILTKLEEIKIKEGSDKYIIYSEEEPKKVTLDPNTKLLAKWNFIKK